MLPLAVCDIGCGSPDNQLIELIAKLFVGEADDLWPGVPGLADEATSPVRASAGIDAYPSTNT
jgi:hypothetical protein